MAAKYLLRMHDVARSVKNQHNIDIMVPHGVKIGGKTFPALSKSMHISMRPAIPHVSFNIPLENGHLVSVLAYNDDKSGDVLQHVTGQASAELAFPSNFGGHRRLPYDDESEGTKYLFRIPRNGTTEDFVSKINEWSEQPGIGVRFNNRSNSNDLVPQAELASHYQMHQKNKSKHSVSPETHPNIITVFSHRDDGPTSSRHWHYNILTEEFKNVYGGD